MNEQFEKFSNIPQALSVGNLFAGWRSVNDGNRRNKIPVNVQTRRNACADRRGDWCDFLTAVGALSHSAPIPGSSGTPDSLHATRHLAGIGRLSNYHRDGIVQIDLDNVIEEGLLTPIGLEHVERAGSYTEYSPSGRGLHIFVRATLPAWMEGMSSRKVVQKGDWSDAPRFELQLFIANSYVTLTGDHVASSPAEVIENQDYVDWILSLGQSALSVAAGPEPAGRFGAAGMEAAESAISKEVPSPKRVQAIVDGIRRRGKITKQLFDGQIEGNPSGLDLQLCHKLVAWCDRDAALIDAVFCRSELFRPKWNRMHQSRGRTYGQLTIQSALASNPWTNEHQRFPTPTHCEYIVCNEKCSPPAKLPEPEPLTAEEDLMLSKSKNFRATMTRRRECFLQQPRQGQGDRSHVIALMYKARALGLGPGKALTLVERFLAGNHVEMPSLQADFWDLWDLAGVQVGKSGSKTRAVIKTASERLSRREEHPGKGRRGYGIRTLRAWKLRQQGMTFGEIAEELGSSKDSVKHLIGQARKYANREDFARAVEALPIVAPPDDPPEAVEVESEAATPPEPAPDEIGIAVTQARRRRGHGMKPSSAAFVAEGIREYCAALKIAPDLGIITAAAEACRSNGKQTVLNAVNNAFARIKAQSMPLIQNLSDVYRTINLRHWGCHFSTHKAVSLSVETLRLVYLETGGDLEAIPWAVLADAVKQSIWPNRVLERVRDWQEDRKMGMDIGSSAEEEPTWLAAA